MGSSGPHTDTDTDTTEGIIASLTARIEMVAGVNKLLEEEQRRILRKAMYLEDVVARVWLATMGPKPKTKPKKKK